MKYLVEFTCNTPRPSRVQNEWVEAPSPSEAVQLMIDRDDVVSQPEAYAPKVLAVAVIVNLTQHAATAAQIDQGVVDLDPALADMVRRNLTFTTPPSAEVLGDRARTVTSHLLRGWSINGEPQPRPIAAMIGGAPFFMSSLETALKAVGIDPLYAFSVRDSVEETLPDGSVSKRGVFRHVAFVKP